MSLSGWRTKIQARERKGGRRGRRMNAFKRGPSGETQIGWQDSNAGRWSARELRPKKAVSVGEAVSAYLERFSVEWVDWEDRTS